MLYRLAATTAEARAEWLVALKTAIQSTQPQQRAHVKRPDELDIPAAAGESLCAVQEADVYLLGTVLYLLAIEAFKSIESSSTA